MGFFAISLSSLSPLILGACGGGGGDEEPDAMPPLDAAPPPCEFRYNDVCVNLGTAMPRTYAVSTEVNTDTSAECAQYPTVARDNPYCIIAGTTINVVAGATLRGVGSRPLVLAASETITIDGILDVSSTREDPTAVPPLQEVVGAGAHVATCGAFERDAESKAAGAGGGAGGSFNGAGGNGGNGNEDADYSSGGKPHLMGEPLPTRLRGGCKGQGGGNAGTSPGGKGGPAGGVVYVVSKGAILINGQIGANGAGGTGGGAQAGGGGGGSGGFISLEGVSITRNGRLAANGGGGGEGGVIDGATLVTGAGGANGAINAMPAPGGDSAIPPSRGGAGDARGANGGAYGTPSNESGGGAGGGLGYILIRGLTSTGAGIIESPAPQVE
jgi:hypothetical protein